MLTENQVHEYHEKGFVILDYKMPENDLEEIKGYHQVLLEKHPEFRDYCPTLLKYNLDFLIKGMSWFRLTCRFPKYSG